MLFKFSIEYRTNWGEDLRICIDGRSYDMQTLDGVVWTCELNLTPRLPLLSYYYSLYRNGEFVWREWELSPHTIHIPSMPKSQGSKSPALMFFVEDCWRPIPDNLPLYSSAYTDIVAPHDQSSLTSLKYYPSTLQLRITEPRLRKDQWLGITLATGTVP